LHRRPADSAVSCPRDPYHALAFTLAGAVLVILLFTSYLSVAKDIPFSKRFGEMLLISLGIAAISFVTGILIRTVLKYHRVEKHSLYLIA
jgi:ABC-type Mn2+/Zn2+ transport system permease subunit